MNFYGFHKCFFPNDLCDENCSIEFTTHLLLYSTKWIIRMDFTERLMARFEHDDGTSTELHKPGPVDDYLCYVWVDNLRIVRTMEKSIIGAEMNFPQFSHRMSHHLTVFRLNRDYWRHFIAMNRAVRAMALWFIRRPFILLSPSHGNFGNTPKALRISSEKTDIHEHKQEL